MNSGPAFKVYIAIDFMLLFFKKQDYGSFETIQ